jgi:hypothetical protein
MEDEEQRDVICVIVQNKILSSLGNAFQDLFGNIAEAVWSVDFERRRPQGSFGDQKCDGYKVSEKCVFQCYGPRELLGSKAKTKIAEDFQGALKHFGANMQKWVFVHNDLEGPPTEAHNAIIELRSANPNLKIEMWGPNQLMGMVCNAPIAALKTVVPVFPLPRSIRHLLFKDLDAIVSHIDGVEPKSGQTITAPSREKLEHNNLSDYIEGMLRHGQMAAARIEEYFRETTRAEKGEKIAEFFRREYKDCKAKGSHPDSIFQRLIDLAGGLARPPNEIAVVIGLVAYFFHSCDVFENPTMSDGVTK